MIPLFETLQKFTQLRSVMTVVKSELSEHVKTILWVLLKV